LHRGEKEEIEGKERKKDENGIMARREKLENVERRAAWTHPDKILIRCCSD